MVYLYLSRYTYPYKLSMHECWKLNALLADIMQFLHAINLSGRAKSNKTFIYLDRTTTSNPAIAQDLNQLASWYISYRNRIDLFTTGLKIDKFTVSYITNKTVNLDIVPITYLACASFRPFVGYIPLDKDYNLKHSNIKFCLLVHPYLFTEDGLLAYGLLPFLGDPNYELSVLVALAEPFLYLNAKKACAIFHIASMVNYIQPDAVQYYANIVIKIVQSTFGTDIDGLRDALLYISEPESLDLDFKDIVHIPFADEP